MNKVMVMGTSIASSNAETTINTSTESASTLATNVTGTDTSTCDSLDLGSLFFILYFPSFFARINSKITILLNK